MAQGCHLAIHYSTGVDPLKVTEIRVDVQSKTMAGDPVAHTDTDGSQLSRVCPDTGQTGPDEGMNTKVSHGPDQALLQISQEKMDIPSTLTQIEMRVDDQLSRTMISHISPPVDSNQLDGNSFPVFPPEDILQFPCPSHGENVGMLQQIDRLGLAAMKSFLERPFLPLQGLVKRNQTQVNESHGFSL